MRYTCFLIQLSLKKYIWDLKANKHVQRCVYRKVYGLNMHMGETINLTIIMYLLILRVLHVQMLTRTL